MKYGPPSPREFGRVHLKLDQAQPEFTRRGDGGEEQLAFLWVVYFRAKCKVKRVSLVRGFPLTPDPSPQKFGVSLIGLDGVNVRIYGERGASMEQHGFKVSAVWLAALAAFTTNQTTSDFLVGLATSRTRWWPAYIGTVLQKKSPLEISVFGNADPRVGDNLAARFSKEPSEDFWVLIDDTIAMTFGADAHRLGKLAGAGAEVL